MAESNTISKNLIFICNHAQNIPFSLILSPLFRWHIKIEGDSFVAISFSFLFFIFYFYLNLFVLLGVAIIDPGTPKKEIGGTNN